MAGFPFFIEMEGKKGLVAGGGKVALRKVKTLLEFGPEIVVVSPAVIPPFEELKTAFPQKLSLQYRTVRKEDLEHVDFVIAATDDMELNRKLAAFCREKRILANTADGGEEGSFFFPAVAKEGGVTLAVSTDGASPSLAAKLKEQASALLTREVGQLALQLGQVRERVKNEIRSQPVRREILKGLAEEGVRLGGPLPQAAIDQKIEEKQRIWIMDKGETKIRLGTRTSALALAQTEIISQKLKAVWPGLKTEFITKITEGDRILNKPLLEFGGKGVFVTEFEQGLLNGEIDFAVHSAKDMPMILEDGLAVVAVPRREDPRDVLITMAGTKLESKKEIVIGTSSLRRQLQVEELGKELWPGVSVTCANLRGNVNTRLGKLEEGGYDAIILAAAGLKRLGLEKESRYQYHYFSCEEFIPAGGQGILAVEGRLDDPLREVAVRIQHEETACCLRLERRILRLLDAGCQEPVGVYSWLEGKTMNVMGINRRNGKVKRVRLSANLDQMEELAFEAAKGLS